jgi:hypothetical protein
MTISGDIHNFAADDIAIAANYMSLLMIWPLMDLIFVVLSTTKEKKKNKNNKTKCLLGSLSGVNELFNRRESFVFVGFTLGLSGRVISDYNFFE